MKDLKEPSFMGELRQAELPEHASRFKITVAASMAVDNKDL